MKALMQYICLFLVFATLSGCASGKSQSCAYRSLIGQNIFTADLDSIRAEGKEVRLLYPDSYIGFKSEPNRVNVTRDDRDEIVDVTCG